MPQICGRKILSNARGKTVCKLKADPSNYTLTLLETKLLSYWEFQCLLKFSRGNMRFPPYAFRGEISDNFQVQILQRWVFDFNSETRHGTTRVNLKALQRFFLWRSHILVPPKAFWVLMWLCHKFVVGKFVRTPGEKPFENSKLTPQTTLSRFWKHICFQIEDSSACWSSVADICNLPLSFQGEISDTFQI